MPNEGSTIGLNRNPIEKFSTKVVFCRMNTVNEFSRSSSSKNSRSQRRWFSPFGSLYPATGDFFTITFGQFTKLAMSSSVSMATNSNDP